MVLWTWSIYSKLIIHCLLVFFLFLYCMQKLCLFSFLIRYDPYQGLEILGAFFQSLLCSHFFFLSLFISFIQIFHGFQFCLFPIWIINRAFGNIRLLIWTWMDRSIVIWFSRRRDRRNFAFMVFKYFLNLV